MTLLHQIGPNERPHLANTGSPDLAGHEDLNHADLSFALPMLTAIHGQNGEKGTVIQIPVPESMSQQRSCAVLAPYYMNEKFNTMRMWVLSQQGHNNTYISSRNPYEAFNLDPSKIPEVREVISLSTTRSLRALGPEGDLRDESRRKNVVELLRMATNIYDQHVAAAEQVSPPPTERRHESGLLRRIARSLLNNLRP